MTTPKYSSRGFPQPRAQAFASPQKSGEGAYHHPCFAHVCIHATQLASFPKANPTRIVERQQENAQTFRSFTRPATLASPVLSVKFTERAVIVSPIDNSCGMSLSGNKAHHSATVFRSENLQMQLDGNHMIKFVPTALQHMSKAGRNIHSETHSDFSIRFTS